MLGVSGLRLALALLAFAAYAQTISKPLETGKAIQDDLAGGQSHSYPVRLEASQFLHVVVRQLGVDVLLRWFGPDGQKLAEVDTIPGTQGQEPLFWVAHAAGDYRLDVNAKNRTANSGRYEVRVEELRTAVAEDDHRVAAQQSFREAQNWVGKDAYQQGIKAYEQAVTSYRSAHDRKGEAASLNNLGIAYAFLSQYDKAIGLYELALAISREIKDRRSEANNLGNLGNAYFNLSQYERGIGYDERALAIYREIKYRLGEASSLNDLGNAYSYLSQYEKGVGFYEQALAIKREIKDRRGEANSLNNIAFAYDSLSQYEKAIGLEEQALAISREIKDRRIEATSLGNIGNAYLSLGQHEKAIGYLEQALTIKRDLKDRRGEAYSLLALAETYQKLGQHRKAIGYFEEALAISGEIKDRDTASNVLSGLGTTYRSMNQKDKAVSFHVRALSILREIKARREEAMALSELMLDWQASAQPRLAIFYGKQAVNTLQAIRSDIRGLDRESQQSFAKGQEQSYHTLADLLISQGRLPEAQQVLNLLKEEEYFDFVRRDSTETGGLNSRASYTAEEAESEKRYREVGDRLVAIGTEHGALLGKKTLTPEETQRLAQLEKDLEAGNAAFQQFLGNLATQFSAKPAAAAKLEQIRDTQGLMEDLRELPAGTVAIYTLVGDEKYRAILITPDVQKAYQYPIAAADLNRKILAFREAAQSPKLDPRPLGVELYKILVGPMAEDLRQAKAQTLMWSLDGALRYVPLGALFDGKQYLIEQYRMSVFTPASNARLKDRPDQRWTAAGFGVTKAHEGASALPDVAAEMAGIIHEKAGDQSGVLEGHVKMDEDFTEQSMREELRKRPPAVHIASHFDFRPGDETKSALLMGDGNLLTLAQIKKLPNLFGGVQVLTLSACNTGVGDNTADGKEVEGFGVLAQRQGAKAVIASLWPVADASTSRLMQDFYRIRESAPGITKLEALRQAQLGLLHGTGEVQRSSAPERALIHEPARSISHVQAPAYARDPRAPYAHPYFWAPFFLMGNWL